MTTIARLAGVALFSITATTAGVSHAATDNTLEPFRDASPANGPDILNVATVHMPVSASGASPHKIEGGKCVPKRAYSYSVVSRGRHRYGPDTLGVRNRTSKVQSATFTSQTSQTNGVEVSASLEIDLGGWIAGVKTSLGMALKQEWTVTKGMSVTTTVPGNRVVKANYGWDAALVRTTLTKKHSNCTSSVTSADVRAPEATTWEVWYEAL